MKTGVILSTYNAPDRLWPTLVGYSVQTHRDFELIIADDGSTEETRKTIESFAGRFGIRIRHVWHPDDGFRKCRIMNQAILSSAADYLIFSDGDCIPRTDFIATHLRLARPRKFLSGGYFKLPMETTRLVTDEDILAGNVTNPDWLLRHGTPRTAKLSKLMAQGWSARLLNAITTTRPTWNGHNASAWRADLLGVNGFDERMGYWAEDRELGERLTNAGIRGVQIRYFAICVHLEHDRPYNTRRGREENQQIRDQTARNHSTWTPCGIIASEQPAQPLPDARPASDVTVHLYNA